MNLLIFGIALFLWLLPLIILLIAVRINKTYKYDWSNLTRKEKNILIIVSCIPLLNYKLVADILLHK